MVRALPFVLAVAALAAACSVSGCGKPPVTERAMALSRTGRSAEALALLTARLEEAPDDLPARRLRVRVRALSGDLAGARADVDALRQRLAPTDPVPDLELGHALELAHRFDEALDAYDDAARAAPASPLGPREGGLRAARFGEHEAAIERLEEAVRRGANDAEVFHALGLAKVRARDLVGAEVAYRRALAVDADAVDALVGLASVALLKEDFQAALSAYEALATKRPRLAAAELGRAYTLARLGRRDEARRAIDRGESLGGPPENVKKLRALVDPP